MEEFSLLTPSSSEQETINSLMSARFPVTLSSMAQALQMNALQAARRLPKERVGIVDLREPEQFDAFWEALCEWKKVTLMILKDQHVFEIEGQLARGKRAQGYYNILSHEDGIGGHIAFGNIKAAIFTDIPFMGRESYAVHFINNDNDVSFSVYVGREKHQLLVDVVNAWKETLTRFTQS